MCLREPTWQFMKRLPVSESKTSGAAEVNAGAAKVVAAKTIAISGTKAGLKASLSWRLGRHLSILSTLQITWTSVDMPLKLSIETTSSGVPTDTRSASC